MLRKPRIENISKILNSIWKENKISRIQIARDLGLNKSTVTDIISKLIKEGLVIEKEEGDSSPLGGRRPVQLELNKKYGYILGIEITHNNYTITAVDLTGNILYSETVEDNTSSMSFEKRILSILKKYPKELEWMNTPILGAGVGISGIIDSESGIIIGSISLKINAPYNFSQIIGSQFYFPVFIENDANSCAWGELTFHRSKKLRNFIFTLVEFHPVKHKEINENVSVGFGIVINGQVYYGCNNSAGEFHSLFCSPKDHGQFKTSSKSIQIQNDLPKLKEFIKELSKHLALFTNTFNLGQIFIGGDIEKHQEITKPILSNAIKENWMYKAPVDCEIRFSSLGKKSVAYGAAGMVIKRIFESPEKILM